VWPVTRKSLGESDPCIAQSVYFERGEIFIAGAQITDSDPVMGARQLDCGIEVRKIISLGGNSTLQESQGETCSASKPEEHGVHRILTRKSVQL
jgi:hypothetical protein